jgi:endonuclease/exonuclease/phosphatase family metal-dependent hydrolase
MKLHTIPRALTPLSLPNPCIITGDLNANHTLWNSRVRHNACADELTALIEDEGWHLINVPDIATYHYQNGTGSSVLDLTIASPAVAREVTNWAVDDENPTGSDHKVI